MSKEGRIQERQEGEFSAVKTSNLMWTRGLTGAMVSEHPSFLSYIVLYLL